MFTRSTRSLALQPLCAGLTHKSSDAKRKVPGYDAFLGGASEGRDNSSRATGENVTGELPSRKTLQFALCLLGIEEA